MSYLELQSALRPNGDILVETLLGVIWQLERELGAPHTAPEQLCTQHLHQHTHTEPTATEHHGELPSDEIPQLDQRHLQLENTAFFNEEPTLVIGHILVKTQPC